MHPVPMGRVRWKRKQLHIGFSMPSHLLDAHQCSSETCACSGARTPSHQGEPRLSWQKKIMSHVSQCYICLSEGRVGILQRVTWNQRQGLVTRDSPGPPSNQMSFPKITCDDFLSITSDKFLSRWYFSQGKCQRWFFLSKVRSCTKIVQVSIRGLRRQQKQLWEHRCLLQRVFMGKQLVKKEAQVPAGECVGQVELVLSWEEVESASCLLSRVRIVVNRRGVPALPC